jgi:hypothetical protein
VTPRVAAPLMRKHPASTLAEWRENGELAPIASRAFWRWATLAPTEGVDAMQLLPADERKLFEEYRPRWVGGRTGRTGVPNRARGDAGRGARRYARHRSVGG